MGKEIWKDIKGYEGLYQVSDLGNVKSLDRGIKCNDNKVKRLNGKVLKGGINSQGYVSVILHKNAVRKTYRIHQLVAIAFLNHVPDGHKIIVDHNNNNKLDNNISNLRLITNRTNSSKDKFRYNHSSKYVGVSWCKNNNKWISQIYINGGSVYLGLFDNESEASKAYQDKLAKIN